MHEIFSEDPIFPLKIDSYNYNQNSVSFPVTGILISVSALSAQAWQWEKNRMQGIQSRQEFQTLLVEGKGTM